MSRIATPRACSPKALGSRLYGSLSRTFGITLRLAGWGFLAGSLLFSGGLYVMGVTGLRALGPIVPVGGLLYLAGWVALFGYGLGLRGAPEAGPPN